MIVDPAATLAKSGTNLENSIEKTHFIKVFVHLAYDKDEKKWAQSLKNNTLVGRNELTPYGYGRAASLGCQVVFSHSQDKSIIRRLIRICARGLLGFDVIHAFDQRQKIYDAEVVWTHTESQFLAVALILSICGKGPKLIGQSVWLYDKWHYLSPPKRYFFRRLIKQVDILTTLSTENAETARQIFPEKNVEMIHFGVHCHKASPPRLEPPDSFEIISVGNDRHRDWKTLILAVNDLENAKTNILSRAAKKLRSLASHRVHIWEATSNDQLNDAYSHATLAIIPLAVNSHASGITAILEAVLAGLPVIASDVGGLRSYFDDTEIVFVPTNDVPALREAITKVIADWDASVLRATRAQEKVLRGPANVESYVRRHVELSSQLLNKQISS